ncbi:MAG: hypothetical protein QXR88_01720 [Candidatus Pacearchaeota archaeon]
MNKKKEEISFEELKKNGKLILLMSSVKDFQFLYGYEKDVYEVITDKELNPISIRKIGVKEEVN